MGGTSPVQAVHQPAAPGEPRRPDDYDVIVIGAGMAGMYQLHRLRELGLRTRVFEAGGDVGGTWYWNRYPGCRFDSESYTYGYSFDEEILRTWEWSEHFAPQPETLRYVNMVADTLDLRRDMQFNTRVAAAEFDETTDRWTVRLHDGTLARSWLLITAIGPLSAPVMPSIPGIDTFTGPVLHPARWPHEPIDFAGLRVAVVGTGATGVQIIQEVAKNAAELTVFQRTPNWCAPLHNSRIDADTQARIKLQQDEILVACAKTFGQFMHGRDRRNAMDVTSAERDAFYEKLYGEPGFGIWMANFSDVLVDEGANRTLSEFVARKIRERVHDPAIAEKLIPTNHGFGTRRVPLETGYYEVYNQSNVVLVDLNDTPIEALVSNGIRAGGVEYCFDVIVFATGFDAARGGFDRIDIRGVGGESLKDHWADGPRTFLGLAVAGFPNMFTLVGPHNAASFCNIPRCIEQNVDFVTNLIGRLRSSGATRVVPTSAAEEEWTEHVQVAADRMLLSKVDSWFTGVNSNLEGRQRRNVMIYAGGAPAYRARCDEVAAKGYEGFELGNHALGGSAPVGRRNP